MNLSATRSQLQLPPDSISKETIMVFNRVFKTALAALSAVLLSACASTGSKDEALTKLCAQNDLSNVSQRTTLAGGYFALEKNNLACAERLTLDAKAKDPKDPYAWLNLGAIYQRTDRLAMAREHYAKTIELDRASNQGTTKGETAHIATRDQSRGDSPAAIAQHNLNLLKN
jgi:tetratricopeptide (TPR) repeat protein